MKLCIFPGTFNPIHSGHIYMAEYVLKNFDIKKVVFIPSFIPPQKEDFKELTIHRYRMVELAIKGNPNFEISDIEYQLKGKSYTYLTLLELYKKYSIEGRIKMIIGTDAFENLDTWYESEKLRQIVEFIVFVRKNDFDETKYDVMKEKGYSFEFAKMGFNDISSSSIREKISKGESIKGLVPEIEERYIIRNGLYKN